MIRALALLGLLLVTGPAWADPFSAIAALSTFAGAAGVGAAVGFTAATWFYIGVAASVLGAVNSRRKARTAQATARAEANAALQDRTATVLRTDPPWQVVYGRCTVGGFYADIITTDKMVISEAAEIGVEVAKPDAYKTNVIVMAAHEVEAIHEVFIDGIPVGPVDGDGWAAVGASATVTFTASTNIVNWTATPAANGHAVTFGGGTLPTGLTAGLVYFVREKTANGFKLCTSPNGPAIDFTTDGSGTITGTLRSPFFAQETGARILTFTDEVTFDEGPLVAVFSAYTGEGAAQTPVTVTIESGNRLVSAVPGVEVVVNFSFTRDQPTVRIGKFYGADDQTTPAYLNEIAPERWTSNHRLRGCAGVVVTLDLEDVRFQGGPPQITADISGRLVHDPRDDSTLFSPNAALCIRDFLAAPWGFEVDIDSDIDTTLASDAADVSDEPIDLVVGSVTEADQPRYTINGSFQTDGSREAVLSDLVDAMGGAVSYGAKYRILPGTWTAPVMSLTDDDLHGQIEVVQADTPTSELFNGIRGQLFLAGAQSPSDFNPYQNATFAADDGRDLWTNTTLPFTNHLARARNLSRIAVEQNRSGQVIRFPAKMKAWPLEIGDRVTVTSAEYGLSAKVYRVTDWQFDVTSAVVLTLQEDAEETYDLADAATADPTPNTGLADPWAVPKVQNVEAFSGGSTLLIQADGTIVPRVVVTWDPVDNGAVTAGGRIEVLWRSQSATAWIYGYVKGADTAAYLYGADEGDTIIIEVRARSARGRLGPSTFVAHLVVGKTAPPSDVENLDWEIKPSLVRITCDPCPDVDYAETELRYMSSVPDYDAGDWAAATFLVRGKSNEYHHPRPPNGTYYVLAKHIDNSGNYSEDPAYITVVVDDSIDGGGAGTLRLSTDRFPFFSFSNGTTHTAQAPGDTTITFTARLQGVVGTATFTAEAFNSSNASLGTFTLGGSGNARTMTAAQFTSLGTSGSVRSVVVEATIGSASDSLTVFRQDSTTTTPRIYLSNPVASVPTDEAGEFGDYSDATTQVQVFAGLSDDTDDYTFAITPDSGSTASINGGAGPVSGTASVTVAVTDSTIDDAAVLIGATGPATLSATFRVLKNEATGPGYTAFFTPAEIRLPVLSSGAVASYADASSVFTIQTGGIDDTPQWDLEAEFTNCDGTLTGATIEITDFYDLGETGSSTSASLVNASGWTRGQSLLWAGSAWLVLGYHASTPWNTIKRSTDGTTLSDITVGPGAAPNYASQVLSCNFDTAFTDASPSGRTLTTNGSATITTTGQKFGAGAASLTSGGYLTSPHTANLLIPGDFTIRCWVKQTTAGRCILYVGDATGGDPAWKLQTDGSGLAQFQWYYASGASTASVGGGSSICDGNLHHVEVTRSGNVFRLWVDGTFIQAVTQAGTIGASTSTPTLAIGAFPNGSNALVAGVLDDLEILGGVALHTASSNFTPDTSAHAQGLGSAGNWQFGAYDPIEGRVILPEWSNSTNYIDSTDDGATWSGTKSFGGTSVSRSTIECGNGVWMTGGSGSTAGRISSNGGSSWSSITFPAVPDLIHYAAGRWYLKDTSDNWYVSSNNGSSWSSAISAIQYYVQVRGVAGRAVALATGAAYAKYSEDGSTWVTVTLPHSWTAGFAQVIRGVLYLVGTDSKVQYTTDGVRWVYAGGSAAGTVSVLGMRGLTNDIQWDSLRSLETTTGYYNDTPLLATSADTGFVTITASKPNEADIVRSLPVRKGVGSQDVYTSYAVPAMLLLPATSDGVVTSYANATITAKINKNGVDDTANWTWAYTTTYLTPSSGSSNSVTVTAMDNAQDQGAINFTATKAGQPVITGTLLVNKIKGTVPSGPLIGAAFNAITATDTWIGVKFKGDGTFQIKVGSGGTYANAGQWHSVVQSSNASTYWIRVEATGHALNSGTTGTWLAMTSDREYTLSDASSGTHRTDLQVLFATSSGGANALMGYGALQLIVP